MPNRLNIGVGQGQATVWDSSPAVQQFTNIIAQQKAQRDAEKKELTNLMGSIKTDGLRDPDKGAYYDKYAEWRKSAIDAYNTRSDPRKRMELQGLAQQKYNELNQFIDRSKKAAAQEQQLGNMFLQDSFRHQFKDDAVKQYMNSKNLSINDPNYIKDANMLARQPDNEKVNSAFDKIGKKLIDTAQWSNPIRSQDKQGNKEGVVVYNQREVTPKALMLAYGTQYDLDPDVRKSLEDRYPDLVGQTDAETKSLRLQQLVKDRGEDKGIIEKTRPEFKSDYKVTINNNNNENASTYRQQLIGGIVNGDKKSIDELQAYLPPNSKVEFRTSKNGYNLVRVNIPRMYVDGKMHGGITEDISLSKGDPVNRINAILNQYSTEKVSPSKLNIKGGKSRGEKVDIKVNSKQPSVPLSTPSKKTIKSADVSTRAAAAGYSVNEYKKLLKANGVTIE